MRRFSLSSMLFILSVMALPASVMAQQYNPPGIPPIREVVDQNGVDLLQVRLVARDNNVSIGGDGNLGIQFSRGITDYGAFRDSIAGTIVADGSYLTVSFGGKSESFIADSSNWISVEKTGSTLVFGDGYIYTNKDGVQVTYDDAGLSMYGDGFKIRNIKFPTGEVWTYNYRTESTCQFSAPPCFVRLIERIQSVTSSTGYMIKLEFLSSATPTYVGVTEPWFTLTKVTALNMSVDYCSPTADICTFSKTWPSLTFGYSGNKVTTVTDSLNNTTTYSYTGLRLTGIQRPEAPTTNFVITYVSSILKSITNNGVLTNYSYTDVSGVRTTTVSDASPGDRILKIDFANLQVTSDTNEDSKETKYEYDQSTRLLKKITAPEGNKAEFVYDTRGNITCTMLISKTTTTAQTCALPSTANKIVTLASYLPSDGTETWRCATGYSMARCNKPVSTTDAKGNVTKYEYDNTHGGITKVTYPAAGVTTLCPSAGVICPEVRYSYTATYKAKYKSSAMGPLVDFPAPLTRLTKISTCQTMVSCDNLADESRTVIDNGTNNILPISITRSKGDALPAEKSITAFTYNDVGDQETVDGPLPGNADMTRSYFDRRRRVVGIVGPDPDDTTPILKYRAQRLTYDDDGQMTVKEIGTANNQSDPTLSTFTTYQQLTSTYDSATARKIKDVWTAPTIATTVQITQYSYDVLGRLKCQTLRMNGTAVPSDACAQPFPAPSVADRISNFTYDAVGRVSVQQSAYGVTIANGFPASLQRNEVTATYTGNGQLETMMDAKGNKTTFKYDEFDRFSKICYPAVGFIGCDPSPSYIDFEQSGYDANGNVTSVRLRDNQSIAFTYDNLNRVIFKNLPGTEPDVTYTYDLLNRVLTVVGGTTLTNSYDALGRQTFAGQPFGSMTYEYDLAGRRTKAKWADPFYVTYEYLTTGEMKVIRENGAASGPGVLATFDYDQLGNRTSLTRGNGTITSYTPDAASRLSSIAQNLNATVSDQTLGFTYNPANQVATRASSNDAYAMRQQYNANRGYSSNGLNQYTVAGAVSPTYDGRGNLIAQGSSSYSYSSENMLKTASGGTTLYYDPVGRLNEYNTSVSTRFTYDGSQIAAEIANPSGAILKRYVFGPGRDEPLVWYEGSGTSNRRWLHADERGSIIAVSDGSGNAVRVNAYDEYGNPQTSNEGRFGYTGQPWLAEIGLYNYKARYYSPRLGRFMQADPIGYQDGMNLYAYVKNDPINSVDRTGLSESGWLCFGDCTGSYWNGDFGSANTQSGFDAQGNPWAIVTGGEKTGFTNWNWSDLWNRDAASADEPNVTPCSGGPKGTTAGIIASAAGDISKVAGSLALGSGVLAVVTSETIIGGVTFAGASAALGAVAGVAGFVEGVALYANGDKAGGRAAAAGAFLGEVVGRGIGGALNLANRYGPQKPNPVGQLFANVESTLASGYISAFGCPLK